MEIALITNSIYPFVIGGIQKHSYFLAKYFAMNKINVDVYHPTDTNDITLTDYYSEDELNYINFIIVPYPKSRKFPGHYIYNSYLFSKRLYRSVSKTKEPHIIYAQGFTSWYFLKKDPFCKNLISNLHGLEMFQTSINLKNKLEQFLLRLPAHTIIKKSNKQVSLGGKLTTLLLDNGAKKNSIKVLPNAIEANWIQPTSQIETQTPKKKLKLIFIGRYERRKGIEEFHDVIKSTIDNLNYEVEFIGPIPIDKQLIHDQVVYFGTIRDSDFIKQKLTNADVLICPSYSEGMPTVILEAMACGCAIIATDVGAVSLMVSSSNGILLKGLNIKDELQEGIKQITMLKEKSIKELKRNSIVKVKEHFTWDLAIKKTIKEIISERHF
ncbi:glycosyltransferase family 4 protein [Tamlana haliotis]|uniref:Glycosyltransferase family 4 protein n=1 Tax=Pseudotamlana haliotis TaxID=2614804 RepID=A0A6N6MCC2_9FLAO|nr:glycosyltransferase family 4 protein [Tamlana haliotis]KAB1067856.1 glycosyltransferase family 4 protein [Tamlana haliotis]